MPDFGLRSLDEVVAHYRAERSSGANNELRWFRIQRTLEEAVRLGGMAQGPHGKRLHHQRRLRRETLEAATTSLLAQIERIGTASSFKDLYNTVDAAIWSIPGIGDLTVYDTALRIGAHRGLTPEAIYLHAGTRKGAIALGMASKARTIQAADLPGPLATLTPREAEDVLCIYKDDLRRLCGAAV